MRTMKVHISPEQRAFIREGIESGRFRTEEDAVQEALALWEERERLRSEILAAVDKAENSITRGEGRTITRASMRHSQRRQTTRSFAHLPKAEFQYPLMPRHRLAPEAEAELDEIWLYVARESGSFEIADHVIDNITERFWLLTRRPHIGRTRDDLRPGLLSFPAGNYVII